MTSKSFESYRFERAMTAILQNVGFHDCTGQKHKCERFRKCKSCSTQKRRARDWFQPRSAVSSEPKFREEWSSYPQIQPRLRNANFSIRGEKCLWRPCRRIVSLFWTKDFAQNVLGVFVLATSWVFSAESLHPVAVLPCRRGDRPSRRKRMHMMLMMRLANKYPYIIINIYIYGNWNCIFPSDGDYGLSTGYGHDFRSMLSVSGCRWSKWHDMFVPTRVLFEQFRSWEDKIIKTKGPPASWQVSFQPSSCYIGSVKASWFQNISDT